jgi:diadenosine tetraphosphate (Ap4A) HIT family hydrolase
MPKLNKLKIRKVIRPKEQPIPFILDPILAKDCMEITDLELSKLLLMNDKRYTWLILVPRRTAMSEIHHLPTKDQQSLFTEIIKVSEFLEKEFQPAKINIGAIGNIVPQLHVHIISREFNDPAWPDPVWGHSPQVPYKNGKARKVIKKIRIHFAE